MAFTECQRGKQRLIEPRHDARLESPGDGKMPPQKQVRFPEQLKGVSG
jgi:hypothetical protein